MNHDQAIEIARSHAARTADNPYHEYQPTLESARDWMPHEWVIDAILAASEAAPTEVDLWVEIHRLRAAVKGPEGFSSWQQAATAERVRRARYERELRNIAEAKRFDRERFDDDASFSDWAQSRARHALSATPTADKPATCAKCGYRVCHEDCGAEDYEVAARCAVCGCEETNSRELFTCECPAPLGPNVRANRPTRAAQE
jgi:hypothetical protein